MHAKPDLRVLFLLARFPFRLGDHCRYLPTNETTPVFAFDPRHCSAGLQRLNLAWFKFDSWRTAIPQTVCGCTVRPQRKKICRWVPVVHASHQRSGISIRT